MLARIDVVTLFPEWIESIRELGLTGRAIADGRVTLRCWNPRDFAEGVHRSVDDRPYGGGPGMVMRPEPLAKAIEAARGGDDRVRVGCLTPQGRRLDQAAVRELASRERLILVCGRYEGIDERVIDTLVDEEWSIGDFVLSGGEPAAAAMIDAVVRLLPGVLGHELSAQQDSFSEGLLDCPHYTRPDIWRGREVPAVLLSGDHARIERWRRARAIERTRTRRPDLLAAQELSAADERILAEFSDPGEDKR
jgi:tRNA (guanine37-N1)-methyltransferase